MNFYGYLGDYSFELARVAPRTCWQSIAVAGHYPPRCTLVPCWCKPIGSSRMGGNRRRKLWRPSIHSRLIMLMLAQRKASPMPPSVSICPQVHWQPFLRCTVSAGICQAEIVPIALSARRPPKSVILGLVVYSPDRQAVRPLRIQSPVAGSSVSLYTPLPSVLFGFIIGIWAEMACEKIADPFRDDCYPAAFVWRQLCTPITMAPAVLAKTVDPVQTRWCNRDQRVSLGAFMG